MTGPGAGPRGSRDEVEFATKPRAGAGDAGPRHRRAGAVRLGHRGRGLRAGEVPAGLARGTRRVLCAGHPLQRRRDHHRTARHRPRRRADRRAARPGLAADLGRCRRARPARATTGPGSRSALGWAPGRGHWLLARRSITDPTEIAYYICYGPRRASLVDLAWIAGSRWRVEECFQQAKNEAGLDHYQVRTWRAWYAHITLSMLALAWLAGTKAHAAKGESASTTRA